MALSEKKKAQLRNDAAAVLMPNEEIIDATTGLAEVTRMGQKGRRRASVLVTDRRVIIYSKKFGGYDVQDYAYGLLTGVDHKKGITGGHLSLRASGDSADVMQVDKSDIERISQLIRDRMALSHQPGQPQAQTVRPGDGGASVSQSSVADELAKLAQLRDQGVLNDEEFAEQKAKLLS